MTNANRGHVLIVDNDPHFRRSLRMLLGSKGYTIFDASTQAEARQIAARERIHVAVLDIRLESDSDHDDMSGLDLADQLDPLIVKIMLSAYPSVEVVRSSYGDVSAFTFVEKEEGPDKLLEELAKAFAEKVKINFNLGVHWRVGLTLEEVAQEIELPDYTLDVISSEVEEALGKLFYTADEIIVSPLMPGRRMSSFSQSGAVILKVEPNYRDMGWGAPVVVKLASRDKIAREGRNYEQCVRGYIAGFRYTDLHESVETHLLGGIIYSLLGTPLDACIDLGAFYAEHPSNEVVEVLRGLFTETCLHWYANREVRKAHDMIELYAAPLKLSVESLEAALQEAELSGWLDSSDAQLKVLGLRHKLVDPIEWLRRHPRLPAQTSLCNTHGDMHSRNVLVDRNRQAWLIDFSRAGLGHIFRDLIELESDIKFTLLDVTDLPSLISFEVTLLGQSRFDDRPTLPSFEQPELKKAFSVVLGIRQIAGELAGLGANMLDYYQGLLLQTLAMLRLRHVTPLQKRHAYIAASLLCQRLEEW